MRRTLLSPSTGARTDWASRVASSCPTAAQTPPGPGAGPSASSAAGSGGSPPSSALRVLHVPLRAQDGVQLAPVTGGLHRLVLAAAPDATQKAQGDLAQPVFGQQFLSSSAGRLMILWLVKAIFMARARCSSRLFCLSRKSACFSLLCFWGQWVVASQQSRGP